MTVAFHTLGCKLNQAETEALTDACLEAGMKLAGPGEQADLVVINSCTVTARSDAKARHSLRMFSSRYPEALVVLTGCYAQVEYDQLNDHLIPETGAVLVPQSNKSLLLGFPPMVMAEKDFSTLCRADKRKVFERYRRSIGSPAGPDLFRLAAKNFHFHSRAFLKIQDGCDGRCAYCRVPLARGKAVSFDFNLVTDALQRIVDEGFAEIVLTGVNISAYRSGDNDLAALLEYAVRHTRHVRLRLSSLEPEALAPRLVDVIGEEAVCPHVHIPVQSGSDRILTLMGRRYTTQGLIDEVAALRRRKPGVFLAADVIVGFPGETEDDFRQSASLVEESGFAHLHVFPFSARPGTAAALFPERVPASVVKERVKHLLSLEGRLSENFLSGWTGREADVLLEKKTAQNTWTGTAAHSFKCLVEDVPASPDHAGSRVWAEITETGRICRGFFKRESEGLPRFLADD